MTKQHIIDEIRRTARDGRALGKERFFAETGIREQDWSGKYWVRWSDAVREAGLEPSVMNPAMADEELLGKLAALVEELGHYPVNAELRLRARTDPAFPSHNTFRKFGGKGQVAARLMAFASASGNDRLRSICANLAIQEVGDEVQPETSEDVFGWVYLLRSGRFYKIGKTNALGRRERELAIQLPERATVVHSIKTDDPFGIEAYWHRRFSDRRKNGEWFELTAADVSAFRRRKFM